MTTITVKITPAVTAESPAEEILAYIVEYLDEGDQAPGHCHEKPGIWDEDNRDKAGQRCYWCELWATAKEKVRDVKTWNESAGEAL